MTVLTTTNQRPFALGLEWKVLIQGQIGEGGVAQLEIGGARVACQVERSGIVAVGLMDASGAAEVAALGGTCHVGALCAVKLLKKLGKSDAGCVAIHLSDGHFWVCAVRDGLVIPNGDRLFKEEAEATSWLRQLRFDAPGPVLVSDTWASLAAPTSGNKDDPQTFRLDDWFAQAGADTAISKGGQFNKKLILIPVGLILAALTAWYVLSEEPPPTPIPTLSPDELQRLRAEAINEAVRVALADKLNAPQIQAAATACLSAIGAVPWWIGTEPVTAIRCDAKSLSLEYHRQAGSTTYVQDFHKAFSDVQTPDPRGLVAKLTRPLDNPPALLTSSIHQVSELPLRPVVYDRLLILGQTIESPLLGVSWELTEPQYVVINFQGPDNYGRMNVPETVPPELGFAVGTFKLDFPGIALVRDVISKLDSTGSTLVFTSLEAHPSTRNGFDLHITLEMTYVVH